VTDESTDRAFARKKRALAILGEADDALAGWSCSSSTECCRFALTGREPWVTQVEWELILEELKRSGRRLPSIPDDDDGRCPFLDNFEGLDGPDGRGAGRCRVYRARPLGCRTFFCERASGPGPLPKTALRALPRQLEALTENERGLDQAPRPLRSWLRSERSAQPSRRARRR
jgi:uncharacterized protein